MNIMHPAPTKITLDWNGITAILFYSTHPLISKYVDIYFPPQPTRRGLQRTGKQCGANRFISFMYRYLLV